MYLCIDLNLDLDLDLNLDLNMDLDMDLNLENHVTSKALEGLFLMLAEEEKRIREDPVLQGGNLFGVRRPILEQVLDDQGVAISARVARIDEAVDVFEIRQFVFESEVEVA